MTLRVLRKRDIPHLDWLPEAAKGIQGTGWTDNATLAEAVDNPHVLTNTDRSTLIVYEPEFPTPGAVMVKLLAVRPADRRLGIGGQTVFALERRLRKSADCVFVQVPSSIGLALYFWLRLGYRPFTQNEWPSEPDCYSAFAWMKRDLR